MKLKNHAFSLIELMAVIAIIGILASIAMPSYRDYMIKSKITNAVTIKEKIATLFMEQYESNGTFMPATGTLAVDGVAAATPVAVTAAIAGAVAYGIGGIPAIALAATSTTADYCLYIAGLEGMSGVGVTYLAPSATSKGTNAGICERMTYANGAYTKQCGAGDTAALGVPQKYLPKGCSCTIYTATGGCT